MRHKVELSNKCVKFLSKLDENNRRRIFNKIKSLEESPFPSGCKKLRGAEDVYRIRVGDFRILYKVIKDEEVILIFKINKRDKVYES
ncbi:MAG: type II toxin-antitoxin system RelE/ParE family toxin [Candidatus Hydrothermarchaeota archaeon]